MAFAIALINLQKDYLFVSINLAILIVIQLTLLIRYTNKTNKEISSFFQAILNDDYTAIYSGNSNGKHSQEIKIFLDKINSLIQDKTLEIEKQKNYLEYAFQKANVGLISFDDTGKIDLFNNHAQNLLRLSKLESINEIAKIDPKLHEIIVDLTPENEVLTHKINIPSNIHKNVMEMIDYDAPGIIVIGDVVAEHPAFLGEEIQRVLDLDL